MASTINASTSSGLIASSDTSGVLSLQGAGTTLLSGSKDNSLALQGATSGSGCGITFPATQVASSDANTLDDYEEGTWSPSCTNQGGSGGTFSTTGSYIKVGRFVSLYIVVNISGVSAPGSLVIGGMPFTTDSGTNAVLTGRENSVTGSSVNGFAGGNSTSIITWLYNNGGTCVNGYGYVLSASYIANN